MVLKMTHHRQRLGTYAIVLSCVMHVQGYVVPVPSLRSSFVGHSVWGHRKSSSTARKSTNALVMYDTPSDLPNKKNAPDTWSALASTERWISATHASMGGSQTNSNPFARKQISYVCDPSDSMELIVAGIFRRLRELREIGENHGEAEKERLSLQGKMNIKERDERPRTHRQTQVIVIPGCEDLAFETFDGIVTAINKARRNARDYVTDISIEKRSDYEDGESQDWITSVNMSHMHPDFKFEIVETKTDEEEDPKYIEYQEKKKNARRSPFPTLVVEVRSCPPMQVDERAMPPPAPMENESTVSQSDLSKLEALFTQSVAFKEDKDISTDKTSEDDEFYDRIASTGIQEVTFITPLNLAQEWVFNNDDLFDPVTSSFTVSEAKHVDAAYEFLFSNIAMLQAVEETSSTDITEKTRNYLVMPHFLSSSATSFEKFATEARTILGTMNISADENKSLVRVSTLHPEHVDKAQRSPLPIFILQWE